ncbi:MAG: DUF3017 domain-containing protein [Frankiales bacterium]|nr:DUF3017 domain-containing protein [Frankiales bacterium]
MRQLPSLAVLATAGVGLTLTAALGWQPGVVMVGLALLLAAGLRLSLPVRQAGWLVVRSRSMDAAVLLGLGFSLIVLATTIPRA